MFRILSLFQTEPLYISVALIVAAIVFAIVLFEVLRWAIVAIFRPQSGAGVIISARALFVLFLVAMSLSLTACGTDLSPREQSQQLMAAYLIPQQAAVTAVQSPQLASKPAIIHSIRTSTDAATAAIGAFDDEARKCVRDQTSGAIVDAPGQSGCNPSLLARVFAAATAAISGLGDLIKSYGF